MNDSPIDSTTGKPFKVCLEHRRFYPCRRSDYCLWSTEMYDVWAVGMYIMSAAEKKS